jgi:hypothetical protein
MPCGTVYDGEWNYIDNENQFKKGVLTLPSDTVYEGDWKSDYLINGKIYNI